MKTETLSQLGLFDNIDFRDTSAQRTLAAIAVELGARKVRGWSAEEERLTRDLPRPPRGLVVEFGESILAGNDPLGDLFCKIRLPAERRKSGATFTPAAIVRTMVEWAAGYALPERVVDPGVGSGRFILKAGRTFPDASLVGVEVDPLCAVLARANLAVAGLSDRAEVILEDYRSTIFPVRRGRTLYIGNPPYVRHHLLEPRWKKWLVEEARKKDLKASQLAGLHVHFYLATVAKAAPGDFGTFIAAAEWLDVNYGKLVRDLFVGELGGREIIFIEPEAMPFPDAATTAAITHFEIGARSASVQVKRVRTLDDLANPNGSRAIRRERLEAKKRWSCLTRSAKKAPSGYVELGELCRVHRGQVTGANRFWIEGPHAADLPASVFYRTVTKARELFRAGRVLRDASTLRRVIDLPTDLSVYGESDRRAIDRFLRLAREMDVHLGYVAANRKTWWSVVLRDPAPILATYMARRPPAFVHNRASARHLNIAHGIYPREKLSQRVLGCLVEYLSKTTRTTDGRTYAGGLTKFEPREMERLMVPSVEILEQGPA
ncbi:MAG TPA: N-6 DNA methylase [Thermoguttaceae bacterium]|nr:N-6 DNA methylase [Thermoguttaceae bacterium]